VVGWSAERTVEVAVSGVCGVLTLDGSPADGSIIQAMVHAAPFRWPDGGRSHVAGPLGVTGWGGHRRGLAPGSGLFVADDVVVAGAVRLDDRRTLLARLGGPSLGADPSDPALVAAAHRRWGDRCVERFVGDYAVAIFDRVHHLLLLARDPMGQRPLAVRFEPGRRVAFASEVAQLLAVPGVPVDVDERAVAAHLVGEILLPSMSFYTGVELVAPGSTLEVRADGDRRERRWWNPEELAPVRHRSDGEAAEHLCELLLASCEDRLERTGPVGVLLSGGVDSGAVASAAGLLRERGRAGQQDLRTYSWGFRELVSCDERDRSDLVCQRFGLPSTVVWGDDRFDLSTYPEGGAHRDDPFWFTGTELVEATLAVAAAEGVESLWPGTSGDFVVGGLVGDEWGTLRRAGPRRWVSELRAARALGVGRRSVLRATVVDPLAHRLGVATGGGVPVDGSPISPGLRARSDVDGLLRQAVVLPPVADRARAARIARVRSPALHRIVALDERTWARGVMALADPWSDRRIVEFVVASEQWRVHSWAEPKRLARRALAGVLPDPVRLEPSSNDFTALHDRAYRHRRVDTVRALLAPGSCSEQRGWIDGARAREGYERYLQGRPGGTVPWRAITLEAWLRRWHR
jgi:asparagine synthase (glutamine-hydrolysing)